MYLIEAKDIKKVCFYDSKNEKLCELDNAYATVEVNHSYCNPFPIYSFSIMGSDLVTAKQQKESEFKKIYGNCCL